MIKDIKMMRDLPDCPSGEHYVPLEQVIKTMGDGGRGMQDRYQETAAAAWW